MTRPDPELTDEALGSEIELLADLIDAASCSGTHLDQDRIDAILHVVPRLATPPTHPGSA